MTSELPQVPVPCDGRISGVRWRDVVERIWLGLVVVILDDEVDFGDLKTSDRQVELRRDFK